MIKYYGTPLTPNRVFDEVFENGRNCLIPFPNPQNLNRAKGMCNKIIIDNGAFTLWRKGGEIDWNKYYNWLKDHIYKIEFFFIPDVIDGTEEENDELIYDFLCRYHYYDDVIQTKIMKQMIRKGVPIWHVNESIERLEKLMKSFHYIAIGSAGEFSQLGTHKWHKRMDEAMRVICDEEGYPKVKVHMLRCLDPKIFTRYPFESGDSTSLAQNHSRDGWRQITERIEKYNSPLFYMFRNYYETKSLFENIEDTVAEKGLFDE